MWIVDRLKSVFATDDEEYGPLHLPPQSRVNRDRRSDIIGQYYKLDSADAERIAAILAEHFNTSSYNPEEVMAEVSSAVDADSQVIKQVVTQQVRSIQTNAVSQRIIIYLRSVRNDLLNIEVKVVCNTSVPFVSVLLKQSLEQYVHNGQLLNFVSDRELSKCTIITIIKIYIICQLI